LRRSIPGALACLLTSFYSLRASAESPPELRWDAPVHCMRDEHMNFVRVQCDGEGDARRCLVAPNEMRGGGELTRTRECTRVEDQAEYLKLVAGAKVVPAVAESEPGYARSERGRAYQVKFDLLNRLYVGASWIPTFQKADPRLGTTTSSPFGFSRGQAEMGLHVSVLSPHGRSRHDLRILESTATFSDLQLNSQLFAYDYQQLHRRPALYLTSFFGKPRLHEITSPLGWGFRVLNIADRPPALRSVLDVEGAEAHASWDPWQSNDMYSHVRVELGADTGAYWADRSAITKGLSTGVGYVGFSSAVRTRLSLGEGGLHYLFMDVTYQRPTLLAGPHKGVALNKVNAQVAYEAILFAINDQPFSIRLAATGGERDDPGTGAHAVEFGFSAGLRFSFWAPARVFEPLPELEDL
jgi:hypothetical protein